MRKWAAAVIMLCTVMLALAVFAEEPEYRMEGFFEYYLQDDGAHITHYSGREASVQIPETLGGEKVVSVKLNRESANLYVKEVILPDAPIRLEREAFRGMLNLKKLQGAERVTAVGVYAFAETGVTELIFSDALENLDEYALAGVKEVTVPDDVHLIHSQTNVNLQTYMTISPFSNEKITLIRGSGTQQLKLTDGVLFSADGKTLISYPTARGENSYTVPDGTRTIGPEAFSSMDFFLKELHIPASVETIASNAFIGFAKQTDVYTPKDSAAWQYFEELISRNNPIRLMEESENGESLNALIARIVAENTDGSMSDYEKAVALHDWLIQFGEYDFDEDNGDGAVMLRTGKGICQAYMEAYRLLLNRAGIPNREAGNYEHAITAVNIGGKWMYVDCTWDDVEPATDALTHRYFGLDDAMRYAVYGAGYDSTDWGGNAANRAGISANDYTMHYWVRKGYTDADRETARTLIQNALDSGETYFSVDWYNNSAESVLTAEVLSDLEWKQNGEPVRLTCSWSDGKLHCAVSAENGEEPDNFLYDVYGGGIRITGYTGELSDVTVPAAIHGIPVTCVGENAFAKNLDLRKVTLPDTVREIQGRAFIYDAALESINMPANLETIGDLAFRNCSGLTGALVLPEGLNHIGANAFEECTGLTAVSLPSTLKRLNPGVTFAECTSIRSVTIAEGVEVIGRSVFTGCTALREVKLPESLQYLGGDAFFRTSLESIRIPAATELDNNPFEECFELKKIVIAEGNPYYIQKDGNVYSADGKRLCIMVPGAEYDYFRVPEGTEEIGERSFGGVYVKKLDIPSSVKKIEQFTFQSVRGLYAIYMEDGSCTELDQYTFHMSMSSVMQIRFPREYTGEKRSELQHVSPTLWENNGHWERENGSWYYFDENGAMLKGWQKLYYNFFFDAEGRMVTGKVSLDGTNYSFLEDGRLENYYEIEELLAKTENNTKIPEVKPWKEEEQSGAVSTLILGDVDNNGVVDGRDALRLMKYLAEEIDETTGKIYEIDEQNAELNWDGEINELDLLRLMRYLGGEIPEL